MSTFVQSSVNPLTQNNNNDELTLRGAVERSMSNYFSQLGDETPAQMYEMVLAEVEAPLLEAIMIYTRGNQSKAAIYLGISRGTLRKKLKQYNID